MEQIKNTAVDYLIHSINEDMFQLSKSEAEWREIIDQAKAMEKEQIADKWQEGYDACEFHNDYDELQKEPIKNPYRNKK
jgi:hypothetical protein